MQRTNSAHNENVLQSVSWIHIKKIVQIISGKVTRLGREDRGNIVRFLAGPRCFPSPKLQTDLEAIQLSTQWVP